MIRGESAGPKLCHTGSVVSLSALDGLHAAGSQMRLHVEITWRSFKTTDTWSCCQEILIFWYEALPRCWEFFKAPQGGFKVQPKLRTSEPRGRNCFVHSCVWSWAQGLLYSRCPINICGMNECMDCSKTFERSRPVPASMMVALCLSLYRLLGFGTSFL